MCDNGSNGYGYEPSGQSDDLETAAPISATIGPDSDALPASAVEIANKCDAIKALLVEKNLSYGNSALEPIRLFSSADPNESLLVRIDDKLSRIARGAEFRNEDTLTDLIGYLVLLLISEDRRGI